MSKGLRKIFSEVSSTYELVNHILTFGLDIHWRKKAAQIATRECGLSWLDVCSGTGEMAVSLNHQATRRTMVVATDFSVPMLRRAKEKPEAHQISFTIADTRFLPFRDGTFDLITISFATRNINLTRDILVQCLRGFYRILRSGGAFVNLETSQPPSRLINKLFHLYVKLMVGWLGSKIAGFRAGSKFLSHSILRFYSAQEFTDILNKVGFAKVNVHQMMFGAVAIHKAVKSLSRA